MTPDGCDPLTTRCFNALDLHWRLTVAARVSMCQDLIGGGILGYIF